MAASFMQEVQDAIAEVQPGKPLAQGTFALWPTPGGGFVAVVAVADGRYAGEHKRHITPQMIKWAAGLAKILGNKFKD